MNEFLKSDTFKIAYAVAVFVISIVLTVKAYREEIDVEEYKLLSAGLAATLFIYLFYLTMG